MDPFKVLGLERNASQPDIKRAYRQKAKELHPDVNGGDEEAAAKFAEVQSAYDMLTNPLGRATKDEHGASWGYTDGSRDGIYEGTEQLHDLFGDIAGHRRGRVSGAASTSMWLAGEDMAESIGITPEEAAKGARKKIDLMTGHTVAIDVKPGTKQGDSVIVPGLGFPGFGGGPPGDLNVLIEIERTPEIGPSGSEDGDMG